MINNTLQARQPNKRSVGLSSLLGSNALFTRAERKKRTGCTKGGCGNGPGRPLGPGNGPGSNNGGTTVIIIKPGGGGSSGGSSSGSYTTGGGGSGCSFNGCGGGGSGGGGGLNLDCQCDWLFNDHGQGNCNIGASSHTSDRWCYVAKKVGNKFVDPRWACPDSKASTVHHGRYWSNVACNTPAPRNYG